MKADRAVLTTESAVLMTEDAFFAALSKGDRRALEGAVADECILIDVLSGSEVPRSVFVESLGSRRLAFESIERLGARVRLYGDTAVVTGETRMIGSFDGQAFQVHSRYTHVYVHGPNGFRLVNAQGTPVELRANGRRVRTVAPAVDEVWNGSIPSPHRRGDGRCIFAIRSPGLTGSTRIEFVPHSPTVSHVGDPAAAMTAY